MTDHQNLPEVLAAAALVGRTGATNFSVGYLNEATEPAYALHGPQWWARATYPGTMPQVEVEGFQTPQFAAEALARKLLEGGQCKACQKTVTVYRTGRVAKCRWTRIGDRWVAGCS